MIDSTATIRPALTVHAITARGRPSCRHARTPGSPLTETRRAVTFARCPSSAAGADVVVEHVYFAESLSHHKLSRVRCSHGKRQGTRADHESADSPVLLLVR